MQKGSLVLATVGLALTIVGTVINEWLVYNPEEWQPNGEKWGAPATIGLWAYEGKTKVGEEFSQGLKFSHKKI